MGGCAVDFTGGRAAGLGRAEPGAPNCSDGLVNWAG
jgi:hypothetical protein